VSGNELLLIDYFPIAREASKRIVEDLLLTAGGDITDSVDDSPSVVRRNQELDDSF
jgi:DASH complex subunit ASK1